jgi:hypothetical protein
MIDSIVLGYGLPHGLKRVFVSEGVPIILLPVETIVGV